ncbi:MAG: hypothetical protein NTW87_11450 [Planctomycetota bacterium]|nr:hypothetical protein [Planctomycetota bacterium]
MADGGHHYSVLEFCDRGKMPQVPLSVMVLDNWTKARCLRRPHDALHGRESFRRDERDIVQKLEIEAVEGHRLVLSE